MIILQNFFIKNFSKKIAENFNNVHECNNRLKELGLEFRFKERKEGILQKKAFFYHESGYFIFYTPPLEQYTLEKPNFLLTEIIEMITIDENKIFCIGRYSKKERFFILRKNRKNKNILKRIYVRSQVNAAGNKFSYLQFLRKRYSYNMVQKLFDEDIGIEKKYTEKRIICVETNEIYTEKELKKKFSRFDSNRILKAASNGKDLVFSNHWKFVE